MGYRILFGLLAIALTVIAVVTFVNYAGTPTDENLFADVPSRVAFSHSSPGLAGNWFSIDEKAPVKTIVLQDSIRPGDLLVLLGSRGITSTVQLRQRLESLPDSLARIYVLRPSERLGMFLSVPPQILPDTLFAEIGHAVWVIAVTSGGASDRAGMKIGDIIVRINGHEFNDSHEADRHLRRAQTGRAITYDVLRSLAPLTLYVTLARFGFSLSLFVFCLSGLFFLGVGSFIVLRSPHLPAARLLGLSYILIGYAITVVGTRREPDVDLFVALRWILLVCSILFGIALSWHASLLFPSEHRAILARRWLVRGEYILAGVLLVFFVILAISGHLTAVSEIFTVVPALLFLLMYGGIVKLVYHSTLDKEARAQCRVMRYTGISVGVTTIALILVLIVVGPSNQWGFVGFFILFVPLATLYTIGRDRLLEMDLRIRRTIQYSLTSVGWTVLISSIILTGFGYLLSLHVHVPTVLVHGTSIEVSDLPVVAGAPNSMERIVFVGLGLLAWIALAKTRRGGQRLIDRFFDRTEYDYRRALAEVSSVLSTNLSMTTLAKGIVETLVRLMKLRRAGVFFYKEGGVCSCREASGIPADQWVKFCCDKEQALASALDFPTQNVGFENLPLAIQHELRKADFRVAIPIRSKERLIAVLVLGEKLSEAPFSGEDLDFLEAVAKQASVSIENAFLYEELAEQERLKHELQIARRIQLASLPQKTPSVQGLDVSAISVPALEVGGDFFDYLSDSRSNLTVIVGDVSGKGTSAAIYMAKVQGIFRSLHSFSTSLIELFQRANSLICGDLERRSFVTALAAKFDPANSTACLLRAGHLPVYLYRTATKTVERITPRGMGLGLRDAEPFFSEIEERVVSYGPGDIFLLASDGITEAKNLAKEEFGEDRLVGVMEASAGSRAVDIRDRILAEVKKFAGDAMQHDDQTVVIVRAT